MVQDAGIDPESVARQALVYAHELHRLHQVEQVERQQLDQARDDLVGTHAQLLVAIADLRRVHEAEREARQELREAYMATVKVLAAAVEAKDDYSGGHIERVRAYSLALARRVDLPGNALEGLDVGAILHDMGKVGVPDHVLTKRGPLDAEEWRLMKQHPLIGTTLLRNVPFLLPALEVVANHHERWDGSGYPQGLRGEAIPWAGRIVAVADAFDALTTDRVYRGRRSIGAAVVEIESCSGSQFDPAVVEAFMRAFKANELQPPR